MSSSAYTPVVTVSEFGDRNLACFTVAGVPVVLCRFRDEFFALENRCSHAASTFDEGRVRGYTLYCPLHGGAFDIRDGRPTSPPPKQAIRSFTVRVANGMVEVDFGDQALAPE